MSTNFIRWKLKFLWWVFQVQSEKKSPKPPREWKTARNILDNVDDGQESNSDKNGQPSPVSVLETPFDEESPSPLEFKEITNDLQGMFHSSHFQTLALTSRHGSVMHIAFLFEMLLKPSSPSPGSRRITNPVTTSQS